jgi:hypothetical protein
MKTSHPFSNVLDLRGAFLAISFGGTHRHRMPLIDLHRTEGQRTALGSTGSVQNWTGVWLGKYFPADR